MGLFSFTQEVAIDLGTANTIITCNDKMVVDEPSVIALDARSDKVLAVGKVAREMYEKTHPNIRTVRPLREGVIADFYAAEQMIRGFIKMASGRKRWFAPSLRMVIGIPSGSTEVEIRAVRLCVRVRPDVDNADFPARFRKDMAEQLRLGNLYLLDVQPLSYIRDGYIRSIGVENEVKTRVAVACFLLANIFLGIIGTFWFRTEYRKGEMGLRMALGSTRRQLNSIMVGEGVLLLVLAFIPSLVISFNIHMDLIDTYQLPFTWLRFAICGGITFVLIVLMIICGVWYPARSTARLEPAEALHYE